VGDLAESDHRPSTVPLNHQTAPLVEIDGGTLDQLPRGRGSSDPLAERG
jgi:hypothetical protein